MELVIFKGFWNYEDTLKHPHYMFIFGDNDSKFGRKGQAIIRYAPNAFGISTQKYPSTKSTSYYTDDEYENNISNINDAINIIKQNLHKYQGVILPENGIGTGLSKLEEKAPKTYEYLISNYEELKDYIKNFNK